MTILSVRSFSAWVTTIALALMCAGCPKKVEECQGTRFNTRMSLKVVDLLPQASAGQGQPCVPLAIGDEFQVTQLSDCFANSTVESVPDAINALAPFCGIGNGASFTCRDQPFEAEVQATTTADFLVGFDAVPPIMTVEWTQAPGTGAGVRCIQQFVISIAQLPD